MSSFVELFGDKLKKGSSTVDTASHLDGKVVGIYFSCVNLAPRNPNAHAPALSAARAAGCARPGSDPRRAGRAFHF